MILNSEQETVAFAKEVAEKIGPQEKAVVIGLEGNLGAGKTTFSKGLLQSLGVNEPIISPTFLLIKEYQLDQEKAKGFKKAYHIDTYRLEDTGELNALQLQEILKEKDALVLVEWAERAKDLLPEDAIWVKIEHKGEARNFEIKY
ncbi:MAG: tRNA (adenosine(37)-N6)-threonylcarbamoyltransferase complex ATPase subunit type 1 TsaE [Candidatus Paceibacterota bacterium]